MNRNWRYSRSVAPEARMKDFDDSKFERVVIPHSNTRLPWHSFAERNTSLCRFIAVTSRFRRKHEGGIFSSISKA